MLSDPCDADDALQNALIKIWNKLDKIVKHPNPKALILRICLNCAYDFIRNKRIRAKRIDKTKPMDSYPDKSQSIDEHLEARTFKKEILFEISKLSINQREVILLRFVNDLTFELIGQALGCKEVTVRKHLQRGREKLKKQLTHLLLNSKGSNNG